MNTGTAVEYVWRADVDLPGERPNITRPTSIVCGAVTPEDVDWWSCDLYRGHDGPHAAFHFLTADLTAVWTDAPEADQ